MSPAFFHRQTLPFLVFIFACLSVLTPIARAQDDFGEEEESVADLPSVDAPDTAAGRQLKWVLKVLNGEPMGEPTERFSDRFLEQFKVGELAKELKSVKVEGFKNKTVDIVRVLNEEKDDSIEVIVRGVGTERILSLFLVTDEKNGKIAGLMFGPAGGFGQGEGDWDAYTGDMGNMRGSASFGAYELIPEDAEKPEGPYRLVPVHEFNEDARLAIGSTFKLWILGALGEEVAAKRMEWTQTLKISESFKSLPSGTMHTEVAGTTHTLAEFATQMISISDNTATDHLLHFVGRATVEAYMAEHHATPSLNMPMLSTRNMFTLKLNSDRELMDRYIEAEPEARREMLEEGGEIYKSLPNPLLLSAWKTPINIQRIEWFASPRDCCLVMADLRRLEQLPGMGALGAALRKNPGIPQDPAVWKSVGFKGGSEPGVMNLTFLLERTDGRWFTLSVGWNDADKPLEEPKLIELAQNGINLLAGFERTPDKAVEDRAADPASEPATDPNVIDK